MLIKAEEIAIVKQEVSDIPDDKGDKEKTDGVEIKLKDLLVDISNFEEILHTLNIEGEKHGVQFKKGNIQYYDDKSIKYRGIICRHKRRNVTKKDQANKKTDNMNISFDKDIKVVK